ncbi:MAG TPA: hypothetical protein VIK84_06575 [Haloplasmataceae bacterium]
MKKFYFVLCFLLLFFLTSCNEPNNNKLSNIKIYNPKEGLYYTGTFAISKPSLNEDYFSFPIITTEKVTKISDIKFYKDNKEIIFDKVNHSYKLIYETNNEFRYLVSLELTKANIDSLHITNIEMSINDKTVNFKTDIMINYDVYYNQQYNNKINVLTLKVDILSQEEAVVEYFLQFTGIPALLTNIVKIDDDLVIEKIEIGEDLRQEEIKYEPFTNQYLLKSLQTYKIKIKYRIIEDSCFYNEIVKLYFIIDGTIEFATVSTKSEVYASFPGLMLYNANIKFKESDFY